MIYFRKSGHSPHTVSGPLLTAHHPCLMSSHFLIPFFASCLILAPPAAMAQEVQPNHPQVIRPAGNTVTESQMALARDFVSRISAGFTRADKMLAAGDKTPARKTSNILPEGEVLLFRIRLPKGLILDAPVMGRVEDGDIALSLRDFIGALEFPIDLSADGMAATGWYIRENMTFSLDMTKRDVRTDQGIFTLPPGIDIEDGDIFVPSDALAQWFNFTLRPDTGSLDLYLESPVPLPVQERAARLSRNLRDQRLGPPALPRADDDPKMIDVPFIDVSTRTSFDRPGEGPNDHLSVVSIRTAGDLTYGTLTTQSQLDNDEKLTSLRANYRRDSLEPELLGPFKARRFEIGDLSTVRLPLENGNLEQGVRITNVHPRRSYLRPSTGITGTTFPGWDVELYRESQLLGIQTVGEDGVYNFDQVSLFSSDNTFRVVMYGPQGERREENLYIPVDTKRLSDIGSIYDISLTRQNTQTYRKNRNDDEDAGAAHFSALYEHPVGKNSVALIGADSRQRDGAQINTLHGGVSTTIAQTLLNLNTAIDQSGEMAAELVARRKIGGHEIRNEIDLATDQYDISDQQHSREIFSETLNATGPLPFFPGNKPRYNAGIEYAEDSTGERTTDIIGGFSTSWNRLSLSQQFDYSLNDSAEGNQLLSVTTLSGNIGLNRLRLSAEYDVLPAHQLNRVIASGQRYLKENLEAGVDLAHQVEPRLSQAGAYLNWDAGIARISPELRYNTDHDLTATLNTRFGISHDPQQNKIRMSSNQVSTYGGLSVFVFLDKDGNSVFSEGDEALPDIVVQAPQNGGRIVTDEKGYAFFNRMNNLRLTDVFIDIETLPDPLWIPAFAGQSVLPREGHVHEMQFPVHMAGEIDGTVYGQDESGVRRPLRGIRLNLLSPDGQKKLTAVSEQDGFYLFNRVPPGSYYLTVDSRSLSGKNLASPVPQNITIGYEGTTLYGRNIVLQNGVGDVSFNILSGTEIPNGTLKGNHLLLNLGVYKSRMAMGLAWFSLKTRYAPALRDSDLLERPSDSYAAADTGMHTLRVMLRHDDLQDAYERCHALIHHQLPCTVETLPDEAVKQAVAGMSGKG